MQVTSGNHKVVHKTQLEIYYGPSSENETRDESHVLYLLKQQNRNQ